MVSADGNDLFLDDGTGIIEANGISKIVKDLFIQKGCYDFFLALNRPFYSCRFSDLASEW